jgi:hypothetical protein
MQPDAGDQNGCDRHQCQRFAGCKAGLQHRALVLAEQLLDALERLVDLSNELTLAISGTQLEAELLFLRGAIVLRYQDRGAPFDRVRRIEDLARVLFAAAQRPASGAAATCAERGRPCCLPNGSCEFIGVLSCLKQRGVPHFTGTCGTITCPLATSPVVAPVLSRGH